MDRFPDLEPNSPEEEAFMEQYNAISDWTSEQIKSLKPEDRLHYLREASPSDKSLMNLYIRAYKREDYETCEAAKAILKERGYDNIPS